MDVDQLRGLRPTLSNTAASIKIVIGVSEAIREAGEIPSGTLYATLCGRMSLHTYQTIIRTLKNARLVDDRNNLLRWIGPVFPPKEAK